MSNALIMMSALVPTTGHMDLIKFAWWLPISKLYILLSSPPGVVSPQTEVQRNNSIQEAVSKLIGGPEVVVLSGVENPRKGYDDWDYWKSFVTTITKNHNWDYVVASEEYGKELAEVLDAEFIPYDMERVINPISGTQVRGDIVQHWNHVLPERRKYSSIVATFFGQESVGKTTLSKAVAQEFGCEWVPEYARGYLETVGAELSVEKMRTIWAGQRSLQENALEGSDHPIICQDTDLLSTLGYLKLKGWEGHTPGRFWSTSSVYYLLPDDVPFEPDVLRYGGNQRESTTQFWRDILSEHAVDFVEVPMGSYESKLEFVCDDLNERLENLRAEFRSIKR